MKHDGTGVSPNGVSVCVVTRNEERNILRCLYSIESPDQPWEILVVDNQSSDRTVDLILEFSQKFPEIQIRVLKSESNHMATAREIGLMSAKFSHLAFIDADCVASAGWLKGLTSELKRSRAADARVVGIGGGQRPPNLPGPFFDALQLFLGSRMAGTSSQLTAKTKRGPVFHLATCNAMFLRGAALSVHFDSAFQRVCEDVDFGWRLHQKGFRLERVPGFEVTHFHSESIREWVKKIYRYSKGQMHLVSVHGRHHVPWLLLPFIGSVAILGISALSPLLGASVVGIYLLFCAIFSIVVAARHCFTTKFSLFLFIVGSHLAALVGQSIGVFIHPPKLRRARNIKLEMVL